MNSLQLLLKVKKASCKRWNVTVVQAIFRTHSMKQHRPENFHGPERLFV